MPEIIKKNFLQEKHSVSLIHLFMRVCRGEKRVRGDVYGLEEDFGCLPPSLPTYCFVAGLLPDLGLPFSLQG